MLRTAVVLALLGLAALSSTATAIELELTLEKRPEVVNKQDLVIATKVRVGQPNPPCQAVLSARRPLLTAPSLI